ncbi:MAG TPA: tyrosine-type recombinase/integrase [Desulfobaccales bacterium]
MNRNHPKKGSIITVEPISEKGVANIKRLLANRPRDLLLFTLGINNGLRIGDLLCLKVKDLKGLKAGQALKVRESKTGKTNTLMLNATSHRLFKEYLKALAPDDDDYLFKSNKGDNEPIGVPYASQLIKGWCREVGLKGNFGSHSLRKSFGCIQRKKFGVSWELLSARFNHASLATTKRYLGITCDEVNGILLNEI